MYSVPHTKPFKSVLISCILEYMSLDVSIMRGDYFHSEQHLHFMIPVFECEATYILEAVKVSSPPNDL